MFQKIANAVSILTFGLILLMAWFGIVAVNDFNKGLGIIFVREMRFHEVFQSRQGRLLAYTVEYTKCGPGLDQIPFHDPRFVEGKWDWKGPQYMRVEKVSGGEAYHPISTEDAERGWVPRQEDFRSFTGDILNFYRHSPICKIRWSGIWSATLAMTSH